MVKAITIILHFILAYQTSGISVNLMQSNEMFLFYTYTFITIALCFNGARLMFKED